MRLHVQNNSMTYLPFLNVSLFPIQTKKATSLSSASAALAATVASYEARLATANAKKEDLERDLEGVQVSVH